MPRIYERVHAKLLETLSPTPWKMRLMKPRSPGLAALLPHAGLPSPEETQSGWMHLLPWPVLQALVAKPLLAQFGGRVRVAVSGGAPLAHHCQGAFWAWACRWCRAMATETSPVVCVNTVHDNDPAGGSRAAGRGSA